MPACTYLGENEYTKPTSNEALNEALAEVRKMSGQDWRVAEREHEYAGNLFRKARHVLEYELYCATIAGEFQIINFYRQHDPEDIRSGRILTPSINHTNSAELVVAYLYGLMAGMYEAERAKQRVGPVAPPNPQADAPVDVPLPELTLRILPMSLKPLALAIYTNDGRMLPDQTTLTIVSEPDDVARATVTFLIGERVVIERVPALER